MVTRYDTVTRTATDQKTSDDAKSGQSCAWHGITRELPLRTIKDIILFSTKAKVLEVDMELLMC